MQAGVKVEYQARKLLRRFDRLPGQVQTGIRKGLQRGLILMETRVRAGTGIKSRRGAAGLMGRLTSYSVITPGGGVDAAIGFRKTKGFPYELSQEFGATAKPGKAMSIPLDRTAKGMSARGRGPREYPGDLVLRISRGGKALLFPKGKNDAPPAYVLVKRIKPRLRFRQNVEAGKSQLFREVLRGAREAVA